MNRRSFIAAIALGSTLTLGVAQLALADDSPNPTATPSASKTPSAPATPSATVKPTKASYSVAVTPRVVTPGGTVTVSGDGYPANSIVHVVLGVPNSGDVRDPVVAEVDATGGISLQVKAPTVNGSYTVWVYPTGTSVTTPLATTTFMVNSALSIKLSPSTARPGQQVKVTASGLAPNTTVPVVVAVADSDDPGTTRTAKVNSQGRLVTWITAPKQAGNYTVMVLRSDTSDPSMGTIQIQAPLKVTSASTGLPKTGH